MYAFSIVLKGEKGEKRVGKLVTFLQSQSLIVAVFDGSVTIVHARFSAYPTQNAVSVPVAILHYFRKCATFDYEDTLIATVQASPN